MLNEDKKLIDLAYMQLGHVQLGYVNKAKKFKRGIQMTFLKRRDLFYMQDGGYINQVRR